ncbi:uncharacterized protein LOC115929862 [Strongylocentrotus purpuratus]|uniref:Uncharacterized protein n=1 Tax=Strongylocentrotus purpuratus TaxID=7668 RepID=A0A7M7PRM3_STRPU|nr:uncharacterized protein LOC115929862 [Strongylocentrotus purpuratus]
MNHCKQRCFSPLEAKVWICHYSVLSTHYHTLIFIAVSDTTVPSSIIFPLSSVAFLIVPIGKASLEWPPKSGRVQLDHEFTERAQKFVQIHRNSYMVLTSALHGPHEMAVIAAIQTRFIDHNLRILPVHNESECLQTILTIAQATCKPTCNILKSRLDAIVSRQNSEQMILNILSQLGLSHHHILIIILLKYCIFLNNQEIDKYFEFSFWCILIHVMYIFTDSFSFLRICVC